MKKRCLIEVFLVAIIVISCVGGDGGGDGGKKKEVSAYDRCWKSCVYEAEHWTGAPCTKPRGCGYYDALEELNEAEWRGYKAMVRNAKEVTCPKECSK